MPLLTELETFVGWRFYKYAATTALEHWPLASAMRPRGTITVPIRVIRLHSVTPRRVTLKWPRPCTQERGGIFAVQKSLTHHVLREQHHHERN